MANGESSRALESLRARLVLRQRLERNPELADKLRAAEKRKFLDEFYRGGRSGRRVPWAPAETKIAAE
jgi:hypothetical protein